MRPSSLVISLATLGWAAGLVAAQVTTNLWHEPAVEGTWLRPPAQSGPAKPVWGFAEGLRIGITPLPGPRGLLRVYTPYAGQPPWRTINFIAIEPIVAGQGWRGYSELEPSAIEPGNGKVFWSLDHPGDWVPRNPTAPARGVIETIDGVATLSVFIGIEPFRSGASVYLRLRFRANRPREVEITTFTQPGSRPLSACIVTATMGNYARLRRLHLVPDVVEARDLFAGATLNQWGFKPHVRIALDQLPRTRAGDAILAATTDELNPKAVATPAGWRYVGEPVTQYWRCPGPGPDLVGLINARETYWASSNPIPGGLSVENMELVAPFQEGQTWIFGVTPQPPETLTNEGPP